VQVWDRFGEAAVFTKEAIYELGRYPKSLSALASFSSIKIRGFSAP
jgi:hypothetical protein